MKFTPLRICSIYFVFASLWVLVTDPLLNHLVYDPAVLSSLQFAKKIVFILVSASTFFFIIKSVEYSLEEQQKRFEIAADITSDVIWEWRPKQKKIWWGEGIETVFGYKPEQYKTPGFWKKNIAPEDKKRVFLSLRDAEKSNLLNWQEEYWFIDAYGQRRRVLDRALILRDERGETIRMIGALVDKTKEIEYKQAIKFQGYKFEMIAKSANDVLYEWDLNSNEVWWSEGWQSKFYYDKKNIKNTWEWWLDNLHPADREPVSSARKTAINNLKNSWQAHYRIKNGHGAFSFVNDKGYFLKDKQGNITHMAGAISDITDDVQAREKLKTSEEQYRLLFEQNPIPMWIYNPDTLAFVTVNQATLKKYGYSRQQMLAMAVTDLHPAPNRPYFVNAFQQNPGQSHIRFKDCTHLTRLHEKLITDISISEIIYKKRKQRLVIALDITEQRAAEEKAISAIIEGEERERRRIAKELHDGLGQYLAASSMNLTSVFEDLEPMPDKYSKTFATGLELLNYAISETRNIAQNLLPKAIQDYGLELAIESLISYLKINTNIEYTYYSHIKGINIPNNIQINLYRILQEAVNNAIRHGKPAKIDIQLVYFDHELLMTIEDNGAGFNTKNKTQAGIGLRSIKTRAGAMSAELNLNSSSKGTIISVIVPV